MDSQWPPSVALEHCARPTGASTIVTTTQLPFKTDHRLDFGLEGKRWKKCRAKKALVKNAGTLGSAWTREMRGIRLGHGWVESYRGHAGCIRGEPQNVAV